MRRCLLLMFFASLFSPALIAQTQHSKRIGPPLHMELRVSSNRLHLKDHVLLTVILRSPDQGTALWNAFEWGVNFGYALETRDAKGRETANECCIIPIDPMPPHPDGSGGELVEIGGTSFVGFDSNFPVDMLFKKPGTYTIRCRYAAPLPRNYWERKNVWGSEDGIVWSNKVKVVVLP